ncbi:MAG TPA: HNH endonuclease signature motif containing protein, partial [Burkholderiaceae bacterium]|nr:HNH endonuclease signature motif containing protein [Burkholderiaceae bacterium]
PAIPAEDLTRVLFDNRWVCCVCRDPSRPVVVHHIREWAHSHDHSPANLAVLCSIHHGAVHTDRKLELNLTPERVAKFKAIWEETAQRDDASALKSGTALQADSWLYFNHFRLAELAMELGIEVGALGGLREAISAGVCRADGTVSKVAAPGSYLYADADRDLLFRFTRELLNAVLGQASVRNISDHLDRGTLGCLVEGDIIYVQGRHSFTPQTPAPAGSQLSRGTRSANRVVITFVFDLCEATSNSAWAVWLRGSGNVCTILRVQRLSRRGDQLQVECTALAIRSPSPELKHRAYEQRLLEAGLPQAREAAAENDFSAFVDEDGFAEEAGN